MTTTQTEALKLALEALELAGGNLCEALHHPKKLQHGIGEPCPAVAKYDQAITAIKEALSTKCVAHPEQGCEYCNHSLYAGTTCKNCGKVTAQPEQEPVAWMIWGDNNVPSLTFTKPKDKYVFDALYTTPPQRTWVGLNEQEVDDCYDLVMFDSEITPSRFRIYQAIEAKLKAKNERKEKNTRNGGCL